MSVTWQVAERPWCCHMQVGLHRSLAGRKRLISSFLKNGERRILLLQNPLHIPCECCAYILKVWEKQEWKSSRSN